MLDILRTLLAPKQPPIQEPPAQEPVGKKKPGPKPKSETGPTPKAKKKPGPKPKAKAETKGKKGKKGDPGKELTPKEIATMNNEPYVSIVAVTLDPNDVSNGAFDLDWNDKFIVNLIRSGYQLSPKDTDADIVDRWFGQVCRNVTMQVYEQMQADPAQRNQMTRTIIRRDLGGGKAELS